MREHSTSIVKEATCPILDVSFEEAVAKSRLSEEAKRKAELSVTSHDFVDLWDAVIDLAGVRFHPLSLGRKMANGTLAPIFLACTCAPNLRVGLERVARYKALFGPVVMVISNGRKGLRLEIRQERDDIDLPVSLAVPMSVFVVEKARNHTARQINPVFVSLPACGLEAAEAEAYYGCRPVRSETVSLEFTEKDANTRFISENDALWQDVERELEQLLQEQNAALPFHAQVEAAIRTQLYSGPTHVEAICTELGISRSTLQRRLRDEGYTFHDILDLIRFDLATRYLTKSDFSMSEISKMIGFMDPKSFFRAFKRKYGHTPEEYRLKSSRLK
ncbi:MAG: helix-turn-helix domain-containing protein [Alphaproteobacteria bacterium]|nr:helix-turn-helix domain-containing protein [Alphaproteobacteria bacterium]